MSKSKTGGDQWLLGYATAMASVLRCTHDYSGVRKAINADGITIEQLAPVMAAHQMNGRDVQLIVAAIRKEPDDAR